ncbi:Uncharacterised protein [Streptococcus suis]|nr:Uncharacterised protein [Streptococcus suis]CYV28645.1 Uncharacterised protein [Streptococcus suis]
MLLTILIIFATAIINSIVGWIVHRLLDRLVDKDS